MRTLSDSIHDGVSLLLHELMIHLSSKIQLHLRSMGEHKMSPLFRFSSFQWMCIIQYLSAEDFKALRLAGNKAMCLTDPTLTSHLQLRMDKAPFFCADSNFSEERVRQWLINRNRLVINDVNARLCPSRVAYLVSSGLLDSISQIIIYDCHLHRTIISILATLPNVESLMLIDQGDQREALDELESIIRYVGKMTSLKKLDIEFDCVVNGSRLSFLGGLQGLNYLRLRGFDLSEGIHNMWGLRFLESLHLCHGNFYSSPDDDVNEKDLMHLNGLTHVRSLHLEGFDCLTNLGLEPFCASRSVRDLTLKHCQELSEECLPCIGRMTSLRSLHIVHSVYDNFITFESESLRYLNSLSMLKSLSLFYVLTKPADLNTLQSLTSLVTLNVAFDEDVSEEDVENMCQTILPNFVSLQKIRIFSEEGMNFCFNRGNLKIEFAQFNFGDLVYLD